ncbi:SPW repeat protein [Fictibacillus sp. Mic-4]|uniref:SPW repeat protein n=1 Tax=Fictibacillus TaxID=1329200 RepID=UPI000412D95B|nr:SPW repeat protein [Fictibacillus gelatini]
MWQTWLSGLIGIWLIISPWIYKFDGNNGALWNNIVFGAIILILAIWSGTTTKNQKP